MVLDGTLIWNPFSSRELLGINLGDIIPPLPMALPLHIPKCIQSPAHCFHPPPLDRPVRIHIEGPLASIQKLLPEVSWHVDVHEKKFQQTGAKLEELTYQTIYGHDVRLHVENDLAMRDEYLGWVDQKK